MNISLLSFPGLVFWCCHLCGKCKGRAEQEKSAACRKILWGSLLSACLAALFITSVAALIANFHLNDGIENLPGKLKNISEDVERYFNNTKDSFETALVGKAEIIENDVLRKIVTDTENNLIAKIVTLERQLQSSQNSLTVLVSSCKEQEQCSQFLDPAGDISLFLIQDIQDIRDIRQELENYASKNKTKTSRSSSLTKNLESINKEVQERLNTIQVLLANLTNTMSSTSSAYQGYVHYV